MSSYTHTHRAQISASTQGMGWRPDAKQHLWFSVEAESKDKALARLLAFVTELHAHLGELELET